MAEFDELEKALSTELARVGAQARPPLDAWERFESRFDQDSREAMSPTIVTASPTAISDDDLSVGLTLVPPSDHLTAIRPKRRAGGRWPVLATGAALIAFAIAGVVLSGIVSDDPGGAARTPTIELRGAEGDPDAVEAFTAIEAAFGAFNAGDLVGWIVPRTAPQTDLSVENLADVESELAAGAHYDVAHCDYLGFGEFAREGHQGYEPVEAHLFECEATMTDAFTTAAGIEVEEYFRWLVADGRVVDAMSDQVAGASDLEAFLFSFARWLAREHPDSFDLIAYGEYPSADDMAEALSLLDEFTASADDWPRD